MYFHKTDVNSGAIAEFRMNPQSLLFVLNLVPVSLQSLNVLVIAPKGKLDLPNCLGQFNLLKIFYVNFSFVII